MLCQRVRDSDLLTRLLCFAPVYSLTDIPKKASEERDARAARRERGEEWFAQGALGRS